MKDKWNKFLATKLSKKLILVTKIVIVIGLPVW